MSTYASPKRPDPDDVLTKLFLCLLSLFVAVMFFYVLVGLGGYNEFN